MEELNLGRGTGRGGASEAGLVPALTEADAFMTGRDEVHGVGIGATEEGERCVVLFAAGLPEDMVPDRLDGLPVRVQESDSIVAQPEDSHSVAARPDDSD